MKTAPAVTEAVEVLERTPRILSAWMSGLSTPWLDDREAEGTFSPRDVVGHLIHGEKTDWMPRVRLIREFADRRPFEAFDRVGFQDANAGRSMDSLLEEFAQLRRENLAELVALGLGEEDLRARGLHPALGPVELGQLIATWVTHDLNHLGQIARVMARRNDRAVGPWKDYLGILSWNSRAGRA